MVASNSDISSPDMMASSSLTHGSISISNVQDVMTSVMSPDFTSISASAVPAAASVCDVSSIVTTDPENVHGEYARFRSGFLM